MHTPAEFKPHHISASRDDLAGNHGLGRYVFLPGSDGRAKKIAGHFDDVTVRPSDRGHNLYLGKLKRKGLAIDVAAVSSGMGCPSVDIIMTELLKLGARRFLRVGTAGSLQGDRILVPSVVIATAAVRDEHTSAMYAPVEYPAVASPLMVQALSAAAHELGIADRVFKGVVHSKDSLFAREFGEGPFSVENHTYMARLKSLEVLASEMEASHLFVLASVQGAAVRSLAEGDAGTPAVLAGCTLAIIGDCQPFSEPANAEKALEMNISLALQGIAELASIELAAVTAKR